MDTTAGANETKQEAIKKISTPPHQQGGHGDPTSEITEEITEDITEDTREEIAEYNKGKKDLRKLSKDKDAQTRSIQKNEEDKKEKTKSRGPVGAPLKRKFVVNFKRESDEDVARFNEIMDELNSSAVGEIPFEEIVWYLVTQRMDESDYRRIREMAFARKVEAARARYNKENKTDYSLMEFIAVTAGDSFEANL
jgi:hypothetical protein